MRFGSLFSGIGGFDLGFERAGLKSEWQVENDGDCNRVLTKHWEGVTRYGDVRAIKAMREVWRDEAARRISPTAERFAGPTLLVQAMREPTHAGASEQELQARTTKMLAVCDSVQDNRRGGGQDDPGAERTLRDLQKTDETTLRGSLPSDEQGARRTLSSLQSEASDSRGSDISESSTEILAPVDVICVGFPCQDLSVAGKRVGLDGSRSSLFYDVIRIVREMRRQTNGRSPAFLVLENVPGIFSSNGGRDFAVVLRELAESGAMDIGWAVLDAQWFGVAQRRRRMLLVADFRGERAAEILSIPYRLQGNPPTRREAGKRVAPTVRGGTKSGSNEFGNKIAVTTDQRLQVCGAVSSKWAKGTGGPAGDEAYSLVTYALRSEGADASEDGTGRGTPLVVDRLEHHRFHCLTCGRWFGVNDYEERIVTCPSCGETHITKITDVLDYDPDIAATLNSGGNNGGFRGELGEHLIAFSSKDHGADAGEISPTLRSQNFKDSHINGGGQVAIAFTLHGSDKTVSTANATEVAGSVRTKAPGSIENSSTTIVMETLQPKGYNDGHASPQETHAREVLRALRQEVGEAAFAEWGLGILDSLQPAEVLQSDLHGESVCGAEESRSRLDDSASSRETDLSGGAVREVRQTGRKRCPPQERRLARQLTRELRADLSQLPHEGPPPAWFLRGLWQASEGLGALQHALDTLSEVWRSDEGQARRDGELGNLTRQENRGVSYGVRRLTPL